MARARNIKPAFFKNEDLAELPAEVRLLFIGLWTLADREGRLEDRPKRIKIELFVYDSFDVDSMLSELQSKGFLTRYEVDGCRYIYIKNFVKHQDPHYRERASEIPPPPGVSDCIVAKGVTRTQRQRIYERDGFKCKKCGETDHLSIDHIIPIAKGGDSSDSNLQVLCYPCNHKKGAKVDSRLNEVRVNVDSTSSGADLGPVPLNPDSLNPDCLNPDSLIPESLCTWVLEQGYDREYAQSHWQFFVNYLSNKNKKYKKPELAFKNCVLSDWGDIRKKWNAKSVGQGFGKTSQGIALLEQMKG
jgi:hypothetical protein